MADLLPSSPDPSAGDGGDPRVIGVDSDDADDLLAALQSETARDVLGVLYDEPATPSGLAEEVDTSIQNVRYHLDNLADADLVEVADTVYSEKGREMKVYAPAAKPLVVFAGNDDETPGIEAALSRLLGGLGVLGLSSVAVQRLFGGPNAVSTPDVGFQGGEPAAETTASQDAGADDYSVTFDEEEDATPESDTMTDGSENATDGDGGGGAGPNGDDGSTTQESADTTQEAADTTEQAADTTREAATTTREAGDATETVTEATQAAEETRTTQTAGDAGTTVEEAAETTRTAADESTVTEATRAVTETTQTVTEGAAQSTTTAADAAGSAMGGLPPGLLFFAGGLVVLLAFGLAWYLRGR